MSRPLCRQCRIRPAAINHNKNGVVDYRSKCARCLNPEKLVTSNWMKSGYKFKKICDQCGFMPAPALRSKQMTVLYVDGNMKNNNWANLKTVCSNCAIEISFKGLGWKEDTIQPDF